MASDLENLRTFKSNILAKLAAMPIRPDYNIDGQQVAWDQLRANLVKDLQLINDQIIVAEGPWEVES